MTSVIYFCKLKTNFVNLLLKIVRRIELICLIETENEIKTSVSNHYRLFPSGIKTIETSDSCRQRMNN